MSQLLEPFTNFLRSVGIDPLLFAIVGMGFFIYKDRSDFKKWKELSKRKKSIHRWTIFSFLLMIFVWIAFKITDEPYM